MAEKIGLRDPANTAAYFAIYEAKNGATGATAAGGLQVLPTPAAAPAVVPVATGRRLALEAARLAAPHPPPDAHGSGPPSRGQRGGALGHYLVRGPPAPPPPSARGRESPPTAFAPPPHARPRCSWEEGANSLLVFQVKLFMESAINSTDPKMVHLLHAQAVHHVITGIYPVEDQMALKLAALQVQARFGDHDPATCAQQALASPSLAALTHPSRPSHKIGFLTQRLREFIPAPLFRMSSKSAEAWETLLWEVRVVQCCRLGFRAMGKGSIARRCRVLTPKTVLRSTPS